MSLASVLLPLLPVLAPLLTTAAVALLAWVGTHAVTFLKAHKKAAALSFVAQAAAAALTSAAKAAGGDVGKPTTQMLADALTAAKASIQAQWPDIEASLDAELDVLLPWVIATQAGVTAPAVVAAMQAPRATK